jgi:hypothetical protein
MISLLGAKRQGDCLWECDLRLLVALVPEESRGVLSRTQISFEFLRTGLDIAPVVAGSASE